MEWQIVHWGVMKQIQAAAVRTGGWWSVILKVQVSVCITSGSMIIKKGYHVKRAFLKITSLFLDKEISPTAIQAKFKVCKLGF